MESLFHIVAPTEPSCLPVLPVPASSGLVSEVPQRTLAITGTCLALGVLSMCHFLNAEAARLVGFPDQQH